VHKVATRTVTVAAERQPEYGKVDACLPAWLRSEHVGNYPGVTVEKKDGPDAGCGRQFE